MQKRGKRNKRGLSTVIVTLILILVSLVAVGIIWVVVRNIIQTGTEGVGLSQFSLSAKILDVSVDNVSNNVDITVKRNAGEGELEGISFVFSNSNADTEVITRNVSLKELEQMKFNFHLINTSVSDLISVSIVPLIKQDGKQISGIALDKYNLGKNQNVFPSQTACSPTNCSILGYVCGNWNNGTCSGSLNCGICSGGQTCNSNGVCVSSCVSAVCGTPGYMCGLRNNGTCSGSLNCGTCGTGFSCNSTGGCVANPVGNIIYALSCSYANVNASITSANSGDTVVVPAGSCTWSNTLLITKGIKLKGAGIGNTTIIGNIPSYSSAIIHYYPSNPALDEPFVLTGFSLNANNLSNCVKITTTTIPITKIRLYQNRFFQGYYNGLHVVGPVYGVADHNEFYRNRDALLIMGNDQSSWDYQTARFGTSGAFFIENNNITYHSSAVFQNSNGCQYTFRYNDVYVHDYFDIMDMHGNNHNPVVSGYTQARACLNGEVYSNKFTSARSGSGHRFINLRGGSLLMYNNRLSGTSVNSYIQITDYDDYTDHIIPAIVTRNRINYSCIQDHNSSAANEPGTSGGNAYWNVTTIIPNVYITWATGIDFFYSRVYDPITDTYFYNNTENGNLLSNYVSGNTGLYIKENINYWLLDPRGITVKGSTYQPYTYPHPLTLID